MKLEGFLCFVPTVLPNPPLIVAEEKDVAKSGRPVHSDEDDRLVEHPQIDFDRLNGGRVANRPVDQRHEFVGVKERVKIREEYLNRK